MRFQLYNTFHGDHLCYVEMTEELTKEVVNPDTMMLSTIVNGAAYTLIPVDNNEHLVNTLVRLHKTYQLFKQPCYSIHDMNSKLDGLANTVGLLFSEVEYVQVGNVEDLTVLINPRKDENREFVRKKYTILGDTLADAIKEMGGATENIEAVREAIGESIAKEASDPGINIDTSLAV